MRDYKLYLDDILEAIKKIEKYTKCLTMKRLRKSALIIDGVVRNLEIIGEAAKKIPANLKEKSPDIEWKKHVTIEYLPMSLTNKGDGSI